MSCTDQKVVYLSLGTSDKASTTGFSIVTKNKMLRLFTVGNQRRTGLDVIKLENGLRLKIKRNDWLLADTCPQAANHCALF